MELIGACAEFLAHCENVKKLSPLTVRAYRHDLHCFCDTVGANTALRDFNATWIENAVWKWSENTSLRMTTVKRRSASIKAFARWLFRRKLISTNPLERLHLEIRLPKRLPRNLHTVEIRKLIAFSPESIAGSSLKTCGKLAKREEWDLLTARLAIEVMTLTGVRVGELVKLTWSDIDVALYQLKINGKGNRERQVSLPDLVTLDRLKIYRESMMRRFDIAIGNFLFVNSLGRAANEQYIRRIVRKFAEIAELERRITPHMLRHTAATQLLEAGLDIRFVQKLLGHASITTTEIYTHVADKALRSAICRINIRERLEM